MDSRPPNPPAPDPEQRPDVLGYAGPSTGRMQVIARFPDGFQAALAAAKLSAHDVPCKSTEMGQMVYGIPDPGLLSVPPDQVERAVEILAHTPARRYLTVPLDQLPPIPVLPVPGCPKCQSARIAPARCWGRVLAGSILIAGAIVAFCPVAVECYAGAAGLCFIWGIICFHVRSMECADCGHRWPRAADGQRHAEEQPS